MHQTSASYAPRRASTPCSKDMHKILVQERK
jgi:hypothetical protein